MAKVTVNNARTGNNERSRPWLRSLGPPPFQILSMDGGGIYGLTTARLLGCLCRRVDGFLAPRENQKFLFAGTSAGSINALLLAQEPNPREAVLAGKLEAFWQSPDVYANRVNPASAFWSWFGVTAWHGYMDFMGLLDRVFGPQSLGDLHHNVLITTFNWSGSRRNTADFQWRPKIFYNFPDDEPDRKCFIRDVAYAAASPPPLRAIRDGYGDGGVFAPNPSDNALAKLIRVIFGDKDGFLDLILDNARNRKLAQLRDLSNIALLSVGVGARTPCYQYTAFDYGALPFSLLPTNAVNGDLYPPAVSIGLDAPGQISQYKTELILGSQTHRLDPPILGPPTFPPTLVATALSRFDPWRRHFVENIIRRVDSRDAQPYIDAAVTFLESNGWKNPVKD